MDLQRYRPRRPAHVAAASAAAVLAAVSLVGGTVRAASGHDAPVIEQAKQYQFTQVLNGVRSTQTTTATTVGDALRQEFGPLLETAAVSVPSDMPLFPEQVTVEVTTMKQVTLNIGGTRRQAFSNTGTIAELLAEQHVSVGAQDFTFPNPSDRVQDGITVTVDRFAPGQEVKQVAIPHGTRTVQSAALPKGRRETTQGRDGVRTVVYQVVKQNGKEISRRVVSDDVTIPAQDAVTLVGTYVTPKVTGSRPGGSAPQGDTVWDQLATCESTNNWQINTGNGYYGGLQFDLPTWRSYGGTGYPHQHSREEQIAVAERLRAARGFAPWPVCARKLGLL